MKIVLGNQLVNPPVLLAPLAGITDVPFRNLVQSFGAGLVVSEMVASHEMVQKKPAYLNVLKLVLALVILQSKSRAVRLIGWLKQPA